MERLYKWIETPAKLWHLSLYFLFLAIVITTYSLVVVLVIVPEAVIEEGVNRNIQILSPIFPLILLGLAFAEEMVFRFPLAFLILNEKPTKIVLLATIPLSIVFGLIHGHVSNIPIQGITGIFFCVIFLKFGGMQKKPSLGILASTIVHACHNGFLACILLFLGSTTM